MIADIILILLGQKHVTLIHFLSNEGENISTDNVVENMYRIHINYRIHIYV